MMTKTYFQITLFGKDKEDFLDAKRKEEKRLNLEFNRKTFGVYLIKMATKSILE